MLILEGVHLRQGDFDLSADLTVGTASLAAVIGPSGAGKSTLLAAIAGFVLPTGGRILWDGADLGPLPPGKRPVSILFQDNNLFPHLTVTQNIGLALGPRIRFRPQELAQIGNVLGKVGLAGLGNRKPGTLSGGQQSRVALARVLLASRPLVLLDEPFVALGPGMKDEMLDLAAGMLRSAGRTVLMVTHDPADAARIADHVIVVADGVVAAPVATDILLANPPDVLRAYLGRSPSSTTVG